MKDSFVFYKSFYDGITALPNENQADVFRAICEYAMMDIEPDLTGISAGMFALIKPQLDANKKRYENGKKGAEYGKLGGRPRKNPIGDTEKTPKGISTETPNVNENVNVNVNDNVIKREIYKEKRSKKLANFQGRTDDINKMLEGGNW